MVDTSKVPTTPSTARDKRSKSFFDPLYDPSDSAPTTEQLWPVAPDARIERALLTQANFERAYANAFRKVVPQSTFVKCDFDGDFREHNLSFKQCRFEWCDFGFSLWRRARFKGCTFINCSFTIATFEQCEFRTCNFSKIGISGNETIIDDTTFTNPHEFIDAAYTNTDEAVLEKHKTTSDYQLMRLAETKATVARAIMHNMEGYGNENDYYDAVKCYQNASINAAILRHQYQLSNLAGIHKIVPALLSLITCYVEKAVVNTAGLVNAWGRSVARSALIGCLIVSVFAFLYWVGGTRSSFLGALLTSIDITLLVGYTKHAFNGATQPQKFLFAVNMLLGLCWYSVFLPTLINRISRVR